MPALDIIERLKLLARGDNLDLVDIVCRDAIEEFNRLRRPHMWRIIEVPMYPKGVYGIETSDPEAVESDEETIVYPCLTRANAELIVAAHNRAAVPKSASPDPQ